LESKGINIDQPYEHAEGIASDGISSSNNNREVAVKEEVTCDYCGNTKGDHNEEHCPHKMHKDEDITRDSSGSSSDDDDDEEEDF
jgi:hypothetical protein